MGDATGRGRRDPNNSGLPALFGAAGAVSGLLGVSAGAFGAHALRGSLPPDLLQAFETGSRYEIAHALALVLTSFALERSGAGALRAAGWLFLIGQILFSGSLYILALTGARPWGAVTPLGGICLMAGWLALGIGLARGRSGGA